MSNKSQQSHMFSAAEMKARGFRMRQPPLGLLVYDPAGDGDDHDGIVLLSREEHQRGELIDPDLSVEMIYRLMHCEYLPPEQEFQDKAARIFALHRAMVGWRDRGYMHGHVVLIETNGVGWPMFSFLKSRLGSLVAGYHTVGTLAAKPVQSIGLAMPRLQALGYMRMMLELQRLKSEKDEMERRGIKKFTNELNAFVWKSKGRPEAISGQHDDLIMPAAAGLWFGSHAIPPLVKQLPVTSGGIGGTTVQADQVRIVH